jgi:hypothetical protein
MLEALFKSEITRRSVTVPGLSFTVRSLNYIDRAARDAATIEDRARMDRLRTESAELLDGRSKPLPEGADKHPEGVALTDQIKGEIAERVRALKIASLAPADREEIAAIEERWAQIRASRIIPAVIRAGFVSLKAGDEEIQSADALLSAGAGADALLLEIYLACCDQSGATEEERKNSESPSTSQPAAEGASATPLIAADAQPASA